MFSHSHTIDKRSKIFVYLLRHDSDVDCYLTASLIIFFSTWRKKVLCRMKISLADHRRSREATEELRI